MSFESNPISNLQREIAENEGQISGAKAFLKIISDQFDATLEKYKMINKRGTGTSTETRQAMYTKCGMEKKAVCDKRDEIVKMEEALNEKKARLEQLKAETVEKAKNGMCNLFSLYFNGFTLMLYQRCYAYAITS
jgi:predicted RNase H-like nuclease (RuvC/YqgF family)